MGNNPTNYVDPSGMCPWCIVGGWALIEVGLSAWDAYDAYATFNDGCAGGLSKAAAGGFFLIGLFTPGSVGLTDDVVDGGARLFRFGLERESADKLAKEAAEASAAGFPHGVSTFSRSTRPDAVSARRADVERFFPVHKTGRNRNHYTVQLPATVTDEVAEIFNLLFGRT